LLGSALNEQGGGASLRQAGKNSFPPTPFLFARLLETPSDFFGRRRDLKLGGGWGYI